LNSLDQPVRAGRRRRLRQRLGLPAALAAGAFLLALLQRPGELAADTKIDLHVDPIGFLGDVASIWSSSGGLGQVQAGQYAGYLFPMGPFFALGDLVGLAPWLVHRLWLGALLSFAAWGTVRLLDATLDRPRGVPHLVAGAVVLLNPYVVVFLDRTSVTLLGYAALPWLLLTVVRAVDEPRGWRWPAAFALVLAATGGGVNAAVTAWLLLGPLLLVVYEVLLRHATWRQVAGIGARTALLSLLASAWWIVPVAEHAAHGLNFLPFTETVGAIWGTSSMSESFRLLGYWIVYLGTGYGSAFLPYMDTGATLLFSPGVVLATLLLPALAVGGFAWTRRWAYGPFFLALVLLGLLVTSAGFPEGAPLRRVLTGVYNAVDPVQFMRTTYKAGPLVALGLACLLGVAAAEFARRMEGRMVAQLGGGVVLTAVLVGAAWPAIQGRAVDDQISFDRIPAAWERAGSDLDRELRPGTRALVLPGQAFPFYRWGTTQDPVLPALTDRPVAVRGAVPFADLRAADLLIAIDSLVQQRRLLPGQLPPLLDLVGAGAVIVGSDDDPRRSGSIAPGAAARLIETQPGFRGPDRAYGATRRFSGLSGDLAPPTELPQVRRYDRPQSPGIVRVLPRAGATVVDGSADGLAGLASLGALSDRTALHYAGDLSAGEIRSALAHGGQVVVTDSNRRATFLGSRHRQSRGAVLPADESPSKDAAILNPFPDRGTDAQTVAVLDGAESIRAPLSPNFPQFPEHRPYVAFDGDPSTYWVADPNLQEERRWIQVDFTAPRDVATVRVLGQVETGTRVTEVEIAGGRYAIQPGWNLLRTDLRDVDRLRVRVVHVAGPESRAGAGALAEIRVPGLRVGEWLRPPRLAERSMVGSAARGTLSYLFQRVTGDDPLRRARQPDPNRGLMARNANKEAALVAVPDDPEKAIRRRFVLPAARRLVGDGWASLSPDTPDSTIDRLVGYRGPVRLTSSDRHQNVPARRASSAFDGDPHTAWVGAGIGARAPWLAWSAVRPLRLKSLKIVAAAAGPGVPTRVRLRWPGGQTPVLPVSREGRIALPRPATARSFALHVVAARAGRPSLRGTAAIAELRGPGMPRVDLPRAGLLRTRCGAPSVSVAGARVRMSVAARVSDLDAGRPLRARPCGRSTPIPAGAVELVARPRPVRLDVLRLRDRADRTPDRRVGSGRVVDPGSEGRGRRDGVKLDVDGPSWLVLGESFNTGWRATCDGRDLGRPRPIQGYANGWAIDRGCVHASFYYAPNRTARWAYLVSALGVAAMIALLGVAALRRRGDRSVPAPTTDDLPASAPPSRLPLRRALVAAVFAMPVGALLFSLRAGLAVGVVVAVVLWRGIDAAKLAIAAGLLLGVAVPAVQLGWLPEDKGGFNGRYALDVMAAHWIAVAAWVLLALALWRAVSTARAPRGGREPARAASDGPRSPA
jgi:arabinofuranan 3-O-arabinosyltransferase